MTTRISRAVILTSDFNYPTRRIVESLSDNYPTVDFLVVIESRPFAIARFIRSELRHLGRNGVRWLGLRIVQATRLMLGIVGNIFSTSRSEYQDDPDNRQLPSCVTIFHTPDMHCDEIIARIFEFAPHLGISLGAPILRPCLFEIPELGTINLHQGTLPDYRGMPPAFWEMKNGEQYVGCSVHQVAAALDQGPLLIAERVKIKEHSTLGGLQLELNELSIDVVTRAFTLLEDDQARFEEQEVGGNTYRRPTLKQEAEFASRFEGEITLKSALKSTVFFFYVHVANRIAATIRGLLGRQRVSILLYHRVTDDLRDSVTVGVEQFGRQMKTLARRYRVVSIRDIVDLSVDRRSLRPIVAVTFDDGYADNFEIAAPILEQYGIPAAFFVSTGKITFNEPFEHDLRRLGHGLPNMTWDQLRSLNQRGFEVGSHTVSHLNCAQASRQELQSELTESFDTLQHELGIDNVIFAYPFGRRCDFNSEARDLVKETGFTACLSAYDTYIDGPIDRFNIPRVGIDYSFSDLAFRARLEGI